MKLLPVYNTQSLFYKKKIDRIKFFCINANATQIHIRRIIYTNCYGKFIIYTDGIIKMIILNVYMFNLSKYRFVYILRICYLLIRIFKYKNIIN